MADVELEELYRTAPAEAAQRRGAVKGRREAILQGNLENEEVLWPDKMLPRRRLIPIERFNGSWMDEGRDSGRRREVRKNQWVVDRPVTGGRRRVATGWARITWIPGIFGISWPVDHADFKLSG